MVRPGKGAVWGPGGGSGGGSDGSSRLSGANQSYPNISNWIPPEEDEDEDVAAPFEALQVHDSTPEEAKRPLGAEYERIDDPQHYFLPGVVFKTPWSMPAGPGAPPKSPYVTRSAFGQRVYTETTRFIVWVSKPTHCLALAIHTYGGLGADKFTLRPEDRCRVFDATKDWDPDQILKKEIPISVENQNVSIDYPFALLDLSQVFTVHFYAPVLKIGFVLPQAWPAVEACVRKCLKLIRDDELLTVLCNVANDCRRTAQRKAENLTPQTSQASEVTMWDLGEDQTSSLKTQWYCDWLACPRELKPFSRLDHYRDHLRDFHTEDILGKKRKDLAWFQSRNIYPDWWRCSTCLSRVSIADCGLVCGNCHQPCEPERQKFRATAFDVDTVIPTITLPSAVSWQWDSVDSHHLTVETVVEFLQELFPLQEYGNEGFYTQLYQDTIRFWIPRQLTEVEKRNLKRASGKGRANWR